MSDGNALQRACIAGLADRHAKLVYADWCDENGEHLAALALRWMAKHGRNPCFHDGRWKWYARGLDDKWFPKQNRRRRRMPIVGCWIPEVVGAELSKRYRRSSRSWFVLVKRTGWALKRIRELVD